MSIIHECSGNPERKGVFIMSSNLYAKLKVGLVCLVLVVLSMGGCAESQSQEHEPQDTKTSTGPVIRHDSVFYKTGPQQASPPDGTFKAGTRIEVVHKAGSYTLVRTEDGREGYVASDAIAVPKDNQ
jgi:uncharacterized protein YgiM (DUF1202 family)